MNEIVNIEVEDYIRKTLSKSEGFLIELEKYAMENEVPIVHKEVAELIKTLVAIHKPIRILEVGCAIGYSAMLFCASSLDGNINVVTTERNPKFINIAKENFEKYGFSDRVKLLEGNAVETLANIKDEYDLIFIDAAKGQYKQFFDITIQNLRKGGIVISDNVLYKGMVASDNLLVRRKKTLVKRLREYLDFLCTDERYRTTILPVGDGVAITYKL